MSCHSQLLFSIQFYLELPLPYSSGCIWILLSPFLTPNLFSKYSVVTHFFHGLVALTYFWIILGNGVEMCLQMLLLMLQNVAAVLGCDAWPQSGEIQRAGVMYVQPSAISSVSNIFTSFRWINFLSHCTVRCYAPAEGALSNDAVWRLSVCLSVCLSVAYIGPKSRTERPRKTKVGTKVAHVTRDSDTTFKVKRSRSRARRGHIVVVSRLQVVMVYV